MGYQCCQHSFTPDTSSLPLQVVGEEAYMEKDSSDVSPSELSFLPGLHSCGMRASIEC